MPPILRWAHGLMLVPADVPTSVRWVLESSCSLDTDVGAHPDDWIRQIRHGLRTRRSYPRSGMIRTDANDISLARNMLDLDLINTEPQCENEAKAEGFDLGDDWPDTGCLVWCDWCRSLVLRDRLDYWLDQAGFPKNAWIEDAGNCEEWWDAVWCGDRPRALAALHLAAAPAAEGATP